MDEISASKYEVSSDNSKAYKAIDSTICELNDGENPITRNDDFKSDNSMVIVPNLIPHHQWLRKLEESRLAYVGQALALTVFDYIFIYLFIY